MLRSWTMLARAVESTLADPASARRRAARLRRGLGGSLLFLVALGLVAVMGVSVVFNILPDADLNPGGAGDEDIARLIDDILNYPSLYFPHNNPTPPTGDTSAQTDLSMDFTLPTASTIYNYDQDIDASPGIVVTKGGIGATESDTTKYQNWRTATLASDVAINGIPRLHFWSGMKNFATGIAGEVQAYLRDFDGSGYTEVASGTLDVADWQADDASWVYKTLTMTSASYTVGAGNQMEIKIIVGATSGDDIWFAYDTTALRTELEVPHPDP